MKKNPVLTVYVEMKSEDNNANNQTLRDAAQRAHRAKTMDKQSRRMKVVLPF